MRPFLLIAGLLLAFATEILRVYFIMPFPGSQQSDTIRVAYFLNNNAVWLRLIALVLVLPPLIYYFRRGKTWQKVLLSLPVLLYVLVAYLFNFRFLADKMFYQPKEKLFAIGPDNRIDSNKLVIGVDLHGEAKAYPIEIIGYHHQVKDTVGGQPVLVTYCTVCRTGRVFSPYINGHYTRFRLVGMDHFNAMLEDDSTGSWWQQATGTAITGTLKGDRLAELPSAQMRLGDWIALHPGSRTLQPDPNFKVRYDSLKGYDEGTIRSSLEKRDTGSWQFKSWVIGINLQGKSRAYDWNNLVRQRVIEDSIGGVPILLTISPDNRSYYAFMPGQELHLVYDSAAHLLRDDKSNSSWDLSGKGLAGPLANTSLPTIQAYQEFWHSWQTFHPGTGRYLAAR